ncbi:winged helix-turn-helix transcriptional regulator [Candidatus Bathyarchaeota archaeon A05DMB-2]|jgi:ArsR family transcriptional regulator|nr:winged helix-turn-helix transcriptional regulator [Candidatus Bathyarchaeota archaeon A05DMB-2]
MKICTTYACHKFFATLANPTRLAIVEILMDSPKNVAQIAQVLQQEQSMVSHNLKPLMECAFVFSEKKGRKRVYSVNKELIEPLFHLIAFHESKYCPNGKTCLTRRGIKLERMREAQKTLYVNHE